MAIISEQVSEDQREGQHCELTISVHKCTRVCSAR